MTTQRVVPHEPLTPQKRGGTNNTSPFDPAKRAAFLSFSPPRNRLPSDDISTSPNSHSTALAAARAIGAGSPSQKHLGISSPGTGKLSRNSSFDASSIQNSATFAGSVIAAQLSISRSPSASSTATSRSKSVHELNQSKIDRSKEDVPFPVSYLDGSLIAAKLSAARERPHPIPISGNNSTSSLLAAGLAVSRSSTPSTMPNQTDQEPHDILPPTGSVSEAKKRLLGHTDTASIKSISFLNTNKSSTQVVRPKQTKIDSTEDITGSLKVQSPTPINPLSAAILAVQHSGRSAGATATTIINSTLPRPVQRSPVKRSFVPDTNPVQLVTATNHISKVVPRKPKPAIPTSSTPSSASSKPENKLDASEEPATSVFTRAKEAITTERTTGKIVPPLPEPRGSNTFLVEVGRNDGEPVKTDSLPVKPKPDPPKPRHIVDSIVNRQPPSFYQNTITNNSTSALPARAEFSRRTSSPSKALQLLRQNRTGPEQSSTAGAQSFINAQRSGTNWRDDLPYTFSPSEVLRPSHTGESFRQALAASSLASSRASSPIKSNPLPLPPRPTQGLRTTMRKPEKPEERDTSPHKKSHLLVKKHPNKHNEGARKRWREFVTEQERKRYEGLWAANRGLYMDEKKLESRDDTRGKGLHQDAVCSLVVKDLWSRSRLPVEVLTEVWILVDRGTAPKWWLTREEFIMGLWLIDQSLKGRKLPSKVQLGTWESVRRMGVVLKDYNQVSSKERKKLKR